MARPSRPVVPVTRINGSPFVVVQVVVRITRLILFRPSERSQEGTSMTLTHTGVTPGPAPAAPAGSPAGSVSATIADSLAGPDSNATAGPTPDSLAGPDSDATADPTPGSLAGAPDGSPAALDPCGREDHPDCGIRDVLDRVGDKWSVLVVVELASGTRRFGELQRAIDGISQRMLTLTVRRLERDGLVSRAVNPTIPRRCRTR